jgi:cell division protein FtsA
MGQRIKTKLPKGQDQLVVALDVGSTKVCCFVAKVGVDNEMTILGMGNRISKGMQNGAIIDMEQVEASIKSVVESAERMAGETVTDVLVNISPSHPRSKVLEADVPINGNGVEQVDIEKLLAQASQGLSLEERHLLHAFPACFAVDNSIGIRDPRGMFGEKLSVALHLIDTAEGPVRNLHTCVARAHLNPSKMVLSPYASGFATLVEDEMELGAACIDLGGGTTSVSVFAKHSMVYANIIPQGGHDITKAIAKELLTPIEYAERLKTLNGNATATRSDAHAPIDIQILGEDETEVEGHVRIQKSQLTDVIEPQVVDTLEKAAACLKESGFDRVSGKRVVLTGGGSLLPGIQDLAQKILGKQVRLGRPERIEGIAENTRGPAYSTCVGLLLYAVKAPLEMGEQQSLSVGTGITTGFSGFTSWFKRSF